MSFQSFLLIYIAFFAAAGVFVFVANKPYYAIAIYYAGVFVRRLFYTNTRVRDEVAINLLIIGFLFFASAFGIYRAREKRGTVRTPGEKILAYVLLAVVPLESFVGWYRGYQPFQILVDIYKVLEIAVFSVFIRFTWRTSKQAEKAIRALIIEMCLLGIYEAFTTERGGIGLHIIMSVLPILFALGLKKKIRHYWLAMIISLTVVFICKTRTYLLGMIAGVFVILCFGRGREKKGIVQKGLILFVGSVAAVGILGNFIELKTLGTVIERIGALFENGLEAAGGYRIYEIQTAFSKFLEAPVFGKGYGYLEYLYIQLMGYFEWGDFMHNTYVELMCKTGVYGSVIYGVGLIGFLVLQIKKLRLAEREGDDQAAGILMGGFGGTICWMVVYMAAPLSSYGAVFLPGIISLTCYSLYRRESEKINGCSRKTRMQGLSIVVRI